MECEQICVKKKKKYKTEIKLALITVKDSGDRHNKSLTKENGNQIIHKLAIILSLQSSVTARKTPAYGNYCPKQASHLG